MNPSRHEKMRVLYTENHGCRDTLTPAVHGPDSHRNFYLCIRHFLSTFFLSFPLPPLLSLRRAIDVYRLLSLRREAAGSLPPNDGLYLNNPDRVHTSRRRHGNVFIFFLFLPPLYPSGFAFCANPALCSSPRQHPHRHLPLGARLLSSGRLETAVSERGRGVHPARRF